MAHQKNQRHEAIPHIPHEIIVEILSRLPVKSLCRFRCVSKPWFSLLCSPGFAKTHLDLAFRNNTHRQRLILSSSYSLYSVDWESINDDDVSEKGLVAVEMDYPLKDNNNHPSLLGCSENSDDNRRWVDVLGSCNGLVCIVRNEEENIFLFNPSTGESKRIPQDPLSRFTMAAAFLHGFGYASKSDDYKLVRIDDSASAVTVYSTRADTWRKIGTVPYYFGRAHNGVLLNGAIHWLVSNEDRLDRMYFVFALDLEEEAVWDMPAPDHDYCDFEIVVGVLHECLCVLYSLNYMQDHFWMMREYGNCDSWTKVTISLSYICMNPLLRLAKDGDALLEVDGKLVMYSFKDGTHKKLGVHGIPVGAVLESATYVETAAGCAPSVLLDCASPLQDRFFLVVSFEGCLSHSSSAAPSPCAAGESAGLSLMFDRRGKL